MQTVCRTAQSSGRMTNLSRGSKSAVMELDCATIRRDTETLCCRWGKLCVNPTLGMVWNRPACGVHTRKSNSLVATKSQCCCQCQRYPWQQPADAHTSVPGKPIILAT